MNKLIDTDQRAYRAKTQKIYLVNRQIDDDSAKFNVMGSTGNIYEVQLNGKPTCSCPDHQQRQSRCKHLLFMLIKIFGVNDPYKEKFTTGDIKKYLKQYKDNIAKFTVKYDSINKCVDIDVGDKCLEDDCCICLDELNNGEKYIYCKQSCGRAVHVDCYNIISKVNKNCPYCMQTFYKSCEMTF